MKSFVSIQDLENLDHLLQLTPSCVPFNKHLKPFKQLDNVGLILILLSICTKQKKVEKKNKSNLLREQILQRDV